MNLKEELNLVKKKIYSELALKKVPHKFREFCISVGANKLFDRILSEVATPRQSTDLANLNQKRVVSVIYNLCYCLGQTCNSLQIDHALYLRSSQVNQEGKETKHIMKTLYSCARRTINNIIKAMSESHYQSFETCVTQAIDQKWLLVLVIDDYTSVHTKRRPLDEKPSEAKTMCTIVVKAFKDIPATSIDHASTVYNLNGIDIESFKGIITSTSCLRDIAKAYAYQSSADVINRFLIQKLQQQRINTIKCCESDIGRTVRKMDNLHLVVESAELRLKSINDFEATYDIVLSTGLAKYMQKFVFLQPGDWPCQFYCRQIIQQCLGKFNRSSSQPTKTLQETLFTSNDRSFYSYPTGNYVCNMTRETMSQQPSILSIVPTSGPLHISLNSREHIVNSFHPFFLSVYQSIQFSNRKLADKPKPWRRSLILKIVYGG